MSNAYFQFKRFRIEHDKCAMKVSTDACILGAWTPISEHAKNVLDIGTGTGLLALMLAQRNRGISIDAIELDSSAAGQAMENTVSSPYSSRINVIQDDVLSFDFQKKYDLIVCNPPFFQNSLQSPDKARNIARHTVSLAHAQLVNTFDKLLFLNGHASVLLPFSALDEWKKLLSDKGYCIIRQLNIAPRANATQNRVVTLITKSPTKVSETENMFIYDFDNGYSKEAISLLGPFYLNL